MMQDAQDTVNVEIPGVGVVAFPKSMTQTQIAQAAAKLHNEAKQQAAPAAAERPRLGMFDRVYGPIVELGIGATKGAGQSVIGLGKLARQIIPGVSALSDAAGGGDGAAALDAVHGMLEPTSTAQSVGRTVEQILELVGPGLVRKGATSLAGRMATEGATSAGVTAAQGGDVATGGAVGAVMPAAVKGAQKAGQAIGGLAVPLVRSAIKPTVTQLKQMAGASTTGLDAQANRLAKFILDNKLAKAADAEAIVQGAERELQALLKANPAATDAPQRAARYLRALEQSAAKQGLPAGDVATIRRAASELLKDSPLSEDVVRTVMQPSPSGLVTASGQPVMVPTQQTTRALRQGVPADEALDIARGSSRWTTRKTWGELKGAEAESAKAVERGTRDAVKAAVPDAKPILQRQGQAIEAKKALDRMEQRASNKDAMSLPAHVVAAGEIAAGKVPVLSLAANWLNKNQMRAGRWAKALEIAIARKDVQTVTEIMGRLGVGSVVQTTKPVVTSPR